MTNLFNYIERSSPIHRLTGATKLICLLLWTFAAMITYDTRLLALLFIGALVLFKLSGIRPGEIKFMLYATFAFCLLNNITIFMLSPQHGVDIYGSKTILFSLGGPYVVTAQQLFYHLNLFLKYLGTIPLVILFVCTTNPSEFAASLNRIGVNYKIAYSVALALRYIPDIQREFHDISLSQQARGIEMSKKETLIKRLQAASGILIPLIMSSMDHITVISNAMELRGFGKEKKRTWYMEKRYETSDYICIAICIALLGFTMWLLHSAGTRFYNPFL